LYPRRKNNPGSGGVRSEAVQVNRRSERWWRSCHRFSRWQYTGLVDGSFYMDMVVLPTDIKPKNMDGKISLVDELDEQH
jgi:hypothetical protein